MSKKVISIFVIIFLLMFGGMYYFLHVQESSVGDTMNLKKGDTATLSGSNDKIRFPAL
ncbi:MAG: hypothetical protein PHQ95_04195 [Candidatus Gracilibacteria bacterium]|nr:hypothetical protein [Candidatus Gracilibacteria bacterium]